MGKQEAEVSAEVLLIRFLFIYLFSEILSLCQHSCKSWEKVENYNPAGIAGVTYTQVIIQLENLENFLKYLL